MRVLVFGASGGIGRHVRERARAAGHELVLFAREPERLEPLGDGERTVQGDIGDPASVAAALDGVEAVISAVGPRSNAAEEVARFEAFARTLTSSMAVRGVRRLVALSGAAVTAPGERKRLADRLASAVVGRVVRHVVAAKQRELEIIAASGLDWVAPRPPRVIDGPSTGRYRVGDIAIGPGARISQADLAEFMVAQLTDDTWLHRAPFVSA